MKKIKTVESAINNLKDVQLNLVEMSDVFGGGNCLFWGRFKIGDECVCYKKSFLAIPKEAEK